MVLLDLSNERLNRAARKLAGHLETSMIHARQVLLLSMLSLAQDYVDELKDLLADPYEIEGGEQHGGDDERDQT